ncbi:MAG TPA: hypothetical protein VLL49_00715 [Anaerolineales bacterium]|nr:hypothetical protein [Anaerolineales bacterium]
MNEYFMHVRSKEKLQELRREGIVSQEFHREGASARPLLPHASRLAAVTLAVLGVLAIVFQ